jgi:hypothetical protein
MEYGNAEMQECEKDHHKARDGLFSRIPVFLFPVFQTPSAGFSK